MDDVKSLALPSVFWNSSMRDFTQDDIQRMAQSLRVHGQIQPIVVKPMNGDGEYEGVCGRLRYEGAKYAHIAEVLTRIHEFKTQSEVRAWELAENLHRKDLTAIQKAEAYKALYESYKQELGGIKGKKIVSTIAQTHEDFNGERPSETTVYEYMEIAELPDGIKTKISVDRNFGREHAKQILRLKTKPQNQIELTEEFVESSIRDHPLTVKQLKKKVDDILEPPPPEPDFKPKVFTVWNFSDCDPHFGVPDFPGRIPGQIVQNLLYYYTKEGDLVVDPMAGSGTTHDVCDLMNRSCICYDIAPIREEITKHDITQGFPKEIEKCDLIFLDPPYFKKLQNEERYNYRKTIEGNLSSQEDFLNFMAKLAKDCFEALSDNGIVALLVSDFIQPPHSLLTSEYYLLFKQAGFKPINRFQVPLTTQQYSGHDVKRAKDEKELLNITRDLYIFRK